MRSNLLLILYLIFSLPLFAQSKGGIEQYHYIKNTRISSIVPVVHFQTNKGWYGEARYNYDERNTFSLLAGKSFSFKKDWSWSVTPMLGIAFGELNGWTGGVNFSIEKNNFFFNTQSQYTLSTTSRYNNFFFNWCELGYQPLKWLSAGVSLQHTQVDGSEALVEPGFMAEISFKRLSFPFYSFNTFSNNRFFILGVNWEWQHH